MADVSVKSIVDNLFALLLMPKFLGVLMKKRCSSPSPASIAALALFWVHSSSQRLWCALKLPAIIECSPIVSIS